MSEEDINTVNGATNEPSVEPQVDHTPVVEMEKTIPTPERPSNCPEAFWNGNSVDVPKLLEGYNEQLARNEDIIKQANTTPRYNGTYKLWNGNKPSDQTDSDYEVFNSLANKYQLPKESIEGFLNDATVFFKDQKTQEDAADIVEIRKLENEYSGMIKKRDEFIERSKRQVDHYDENNQPVPKLTPRAEEIFNKLGNIPGGVELQAFIINQSNPSVSMKGFHAEIKEKDVISNIHRLQDEMAHMDPYSAAYKEKQSEANRYFNLLKNKQ